MPPIRGGHLGTKYQVWFLFYYNRGLGNFPEVTVGSSEWKHVFALLSAKIALQK